MHDVTIRSRADGIIEVAPRIAALETGDRLLVIVTVLLVTGGLFLCGLLPAAVAGTIALSCVAGDALIWLKAGLLAVFRPAAEVHEVPSFARRRAG